MMPWRQRRQVSDDGGVQAAQHGVFRLNQCAVGEAAYNLI